MHLEKERLCRLHEMALTDILGAAEAGEKVAIRGLNPATTAVLVAELLTHQRRPVVVLAASDAVLESFRDSLSFFSSKAASDAVFLPTLASGLYSGSAQNRRKLSERLGVLYALATSPQRLTLASYESFGRRCMPKSDLLASKFELRLGMALDTGDFRLRLQALGYAEEMQVDLPGTYAVRGGIIDVYSPALAYPIRIERFGDDIDEIRSFDPESQMTVGKLETALILAASEVLCDEHHIGNAVDAIAEMADALEFPSKILRLHREKIENAVQFWGIQALMPAYYEKTDTFLSYLDPESIVLCCEPDLCHQTYKEMRELQARQYQHAIGEHLLVCPVDAHFLPPEEISAQLLQMRLLTSGIGVNAGLIPEKSLWYDSLENTDIVAQRREQMAQRSEDYLKLLADYFGQWQDVYGEIALVVHSRGALERMRSMLKPLGMPIKVATTPFELDAPREAPSECITLYLGHLGSGCRIAQKSVAILTEAELFGSKVRKRRASKIDDAHSLNSFKDLKMGDYVVHAEHGIGQYQGLVTLKVAEIIGDFLHINYADAGKLYIPIQRLKSVQKFAGAEKPKRLDKLGGGAWERTKDKVRQSVRELAVDLLELYAKRQSRGGYAYSPRDTFYQSFEADFEFDETPDQEKAIDAVLEDMQAARPMERLLCGDVGFGKTEVAMRAAMRAVLDTKQVAILVPTTILAEQHYENFLKRFAGHPVHIASLNRFRKPAEIKEILAKLKVGTIDIVIGTHRLLSKDVEFKDLGLLVIDEEHRFGVAHKEKIKALADGIDCLTMTATPIPRTFQMCLGGLKDISIIATPPLDRLAITTCVAKISDTLIAEAIERELARGGQVYFLHNRVEELPAYHERISRLVPRARIGVAHGQLDEKALEKVMFDFIHQRIDVLLCTTIIESGIDIASANCLIVSHAERFGLAQLYQIRGRVGRSTERAYCYLLTGSESISEIARERLSAIERFTDLGSGLEIAYLDLEMRGAGNLLGPQQSGSIATVGLEMYGELLQEAISELQGEVPHQSITSEVNLPVSAYLPEDYIGDVQLRLLFYKRLSNAESIDELYEIFGEIIDRFGQAPQEARSLKDSFELKIMLSGLGIKSMDANYTSIILDLSDNSKLDPAKLVSMVTLEPSKYALRQDQKLIRYLNKSESEALIETAAFYLDALKERCFNV